MSSALENRSQKLPLTLSQVLLSNNDVRKGSVYMRSEFPLDKACLFVGKNAKDINLTL